MQSSCALLTPSGFVMLKQSCRGAFHCPTRLQAFFEAPLITSTDTANLRSGLSRHLFRLSTCGDKWILHLLDIYCNLYCSLHDACRDDAIEKTAERISEAMHWLHGHTFLSEETLQRWRPMVCLPDMPNPIIYSPNRSVLCIDMITSCQVPGPLAS